MTTNRGRNVGERESLRLKEARVVDRMNEGRRADRRSHRVRNPFVRSRRIGPTGLIAVLVVFAAVLVAAPFASADTIVRDLGTLPGDPASSGSGINNQGQVSGISGDPITGGTHAFLWTDPTMVPLSPLTGYTYSEAIRLNDAGDAVGDSFSITNGSFPTRATLWQAGAPIDLGVLPTDTNSVAVDINSTGSIVGQSSNDFFEFHAVLWKDGQMTRLGTLGGASSEAEAINDVGQIVGSASTIFGYPHPFLWQDGSMTDLGTVPGDLFSGAIGINDAGQVVGYGFNATLAAHAFIWEAGAMRPISGLPGDTQSVAIDINRTGTVVGYSFGASPEPHAFVWEAGATTALPTLGGTMSAAFAINDAGQITGGSTDAFGVQHAALWSPVQGVHDVAVLSADSSPASVVAGAPVTISATIQNQGTGPESFDVKAFAGSTLVGTQTIPGLPAGSSNVVEFTWNTSTAAAGSYAIHVEAALVSGETDAADNSHAAGTVVVYLPLKAQASAPPETDVGVAITLACSANGGAAPYQFAWTFGDDSSDSGASVQHAYGSTGTKTATCTVTDGSSQQASSAATVVVNPAPSVSGHVDRTAASPGKALAFSADATDGAGGFEYTWSFGDGDSANTASATHTYQGPGKYTATVTVRDRVGGVASSSFDVAIAYLAATAKASAYSAASGQGSIRFDANASGGTGGPYTFTWEFGDGQKATGASVVHVYSSPGTYTAKVTVTDEAGDSNTTSLSPIAVQATNVFSLGDPIVGFAIGTVIVIAAAIVVAMLLGRRRRPEP
jgi:probable HAF family extracellular repeat protein